VSTPNRPRMNGTVILAAWMLAIGMTFIVTGVVLAALYIFGKVGAAIAVLLIGIVLCVIALAVLAGETQTPQASNATTPRSP